MPTLSPFFSNLSQATLSGALPFISGGLADSPAVQASIGAFNELTLPVIQQQLQLQGLGQSPAVAEAAGSALAQSLPAILQNEQRNRLAALGFLPQQQELAQREETLGQQAAQLAANIAATQQAQQLDAFRTAGNLALGLGSNLQNAGQLQLQQQQLALQGLSQAGELQQATAQDTFNAEQADFLRRLGLAESASSGVFGSTGLPLDTVATTKSSGGGKF